MADPGAPNGPDVPAALDVADPGAPNGPDVPAALDMADPGAPNGPDVPAALDMADPGAPNGPDVPNVPGVPGTFTSVSSVSSVSSASSATPVSSELGAPPDCFLLFSLISKLWIFLRIFLIIDLLPFFCLNISREKYLDNNVNLCSKYISNFILSFLGISKISSTKNIKFCLLNLTNVPGPDSHFLLLENEIVPVNKSNRDVGFLEHSFNLEAITSLKVLSDDNFIEDSFNIPSKSLISNNLSIKIESTSNSYSLS